jgi:PAS domain S-box-containing protein
MRATGRNREEDLRLYKQKLERLCRLTADVARLGNERSTLKKIVDTAADLIPVHEAHIALVDKTRRQLNGVISSGRHPLDARRLRVPLSETAAAQQALKTRKPVNLRTRDLMEGRGVAYLPLLGGKESLGLLILIPGRPNAWTAQARELAKRFADLASVALENSRMMTKLAETEMRFRSLVEHIPAITYLCSVEPPFRAHYVSPRLEAMLGYSPQEWMSDPDGFFMKIVHPKDVGGLIDLTAEAARTRGFATAEYRVLDRWGEIRWFRDQCVLVRDPSGTPIAWHGIAVETTGMKMKEGLHEPD